MFDDSTVSETQIMVALIINTCIMTGIASFIAISTYFPELNLTNSVFVHVAALTGVAVAYYLFQFGLYYMLGYIFSNKVDTGLWIAGFKSSQSLLGLLLFPIVCLMLVYPDSTIIMLILSLILYILARIVFVCKGFRIFFGNLTSTVYFILYLCSVEIVPVILSAAGAIEICRILQS